MSPRRIVALALALPIVACAAPAADQAHAQAKTDPKKEISCEEYGGGKPGDKKTLSETKEVNGKTVVVRKYTVICGDDGRWHQVVELRVPRDLRPTSSISIAVLR